jgi:hypothetical protein
MVGAPPLAAVVTAAVDLSNVDDPISHQPCDTAS